MRSYDEYINKLKKSEFEANYDKMYAQIEDKIEQKAPRFKLALASAIAVLLISFALFYNYSAYYSEEGELLSSYINEQEEINGNMVFDYIYSE